RGLGTVPRGTKTVEFAQQRAESESSSRKEWCSIDCLEWTKNRSRPRRRLLWTPPPAAGTRRRHDGAVRQPRPLDDVALVPFDVDHDLDTITPSRHHDGDHPHLSRARMWR